MSDAPEEPNAAPNETKTGETKASSGKEKKQRVLHTRVPESLEEELKQRASELGVSVSNLVRNVLSNAFDMVEDVVADTGRVVRSAGPRRAPMPFGSPPAAHEPTLLGWQTLTLAMNAICTQCNTILPKGSEGAAAVYDMPAPRSFLCPRCFSEAAS